MKFKAKKETQFLTFQGDKHFNPTTPKEQPCIYCGAVDIKQAPGKYFGTCDNCGMRVSFYRPHPIQELAATIQNRTVLMFSGVSTGKTTGNGARVIEHVNTVPGAKVYILAQTKEQRDKNVKDNVLIKYIDEEKDLIVKNQGEWKFTNGSTIYFYTSDSHQKLKSANATLVWLVECQDIGVEIYYEAQQRVRGNEGRTFQRDKKGNILTFYDYKKEEHIQIILEDRALVLAEGNISEGWITSRGALTAHTIIGTRNTKHFKLKNKAKPIIDMETGKVKDIVCIIMSPQDNPYNTKEQLKELRTGKSKDWIDREFRGDLSFDGGIIYKEGLKKFVDDQAMAAKFPDRSGDWFWVEGMDFGGALANNDPTAYLLGKWKPVTGELFIMAEYYVRGKAMTDEVRSILKIRQMCGYTPSRSKVFVCDPAGRKTIKSDSGFYDVISMYKKLGLKNIRPAYRADGEMNPKSRFVKYGVEKVKIALQENRLFFSKNCINLQREIGEYREKALSESQRLKKGGRTVTIVGDDHALDCLRYMVVYLGDATSTVSYREYDNYQPLKPLNPYTLSGPARDFQKSLENLDKKMYNIEEDDDEGYYN